MADKVGKGQDILEGYDFVRFTFADFHGTTRSKIFSARDARGLFDSGFGAYMGLYITGPRTEVIMIDEIKDAGAGNMAVVPDLTTLHDVPWTCKGKYRVGEFFCDTKWIDKDTIKPMEQCPRYVVQRQLNKLSDLGLKCMSSFEWEYRVMNRETGKPIKDGYDYMSNLIHTRYEEMFYDLAKSFEQAGVEIEAFGAEYPPAQFEFSLTPQYGLKAFDNNFLFKSGTKEFFQRTENYASFMTVPVKDDVGSGAHFNHSIWNKETGKNAFYDATKNDGLSEVAHNWIGGIMKHARALMALIAPSVNCYRRVKMGAWAPAEIYWGIDQRLGFLRVKNHGEKGTYMENRAPSSYGNPYLIGAATLAAGIDGIINKIPSPKPDDVAGAEKIPTDLKTALKALEDDVVITESLGKEFVRWYVLCLTKGDVAKFEGENSPQTDEDAFALETELYGEF